MNQNIQSSLAYNGQDYDIVVENTAVILSGSAIVMWDTITNTKKYIWSKKIGFCSVACNYFSQTIAAADYGLNPKIHIFDCRGEELFSFQAETTIKCIALAFSRNGKYLAVVGGVPDFKITVFDTEKRQLLQLKEETKLPCKHENFLQIKFNPRNNNQFCILSSNSLYCYNVYQAYDYTEVEEEKVLMEANRLEMKEFKSEDTELSFVKFIYDPFDRVHICTDRPLLLQVDTKTLQLESQLNTQYKPKSLVITHCHLIVSQEEGVIHWYKVEQPDEYVGSDKDQQEKDRKIKVLDQIEKEFVLGLTIGETKNLEYIAHMCYAKDYQRLVMATNTGLFGKLEIPAEAINLEEEEEDNEKNKEKMIIAQEFNQLGRYSTKGLTGIKELGNSTQIITACEDHYISIWEATTGELLSCSFQPSYPVSIAVNKEGTIAFIGTQHGVFRAYDVSNRRRPRLIEQLRFYSEHLPISTLQTSFCGEYVIVANNHTQDLYVLSQDPKKRFQIYGYYRFEGYILSAAFNQHNGLTSVVVVLSNNLMVASVLPVKQIEDRRFPISNNVTAQFYRKVDPGSNLIISNHLNHELWVTGKDKLLKKYDYPDEKFEAIDFTKPPGAPVLELNSHSIGTQCWDVSQSLNQVATGGKDGVIFCRNINNFQKPHEIKAHTLFTGGVTAISFSNNRSMLYTAGGDGTIFCWSMGSNPNPSAPIWLDDLAGRELESFPEIERLPYDKLTVYSEILEEKFKKDQEHAKEQFRQSLLGELNQIKDKLVHLLQENETAADIEQLERDEFVIDTFRRDKIVEEGENECKEIREEAEKTMLRLELLRNRLKESTWDKMEEQSKAIKSIQSDTLIFNFPIRKRDPHEQRILQVIKNGRMIEMQEKLYRLEKKIEDSLNELDFSNQKEQYIMNRFQGKANFVEDDSILKAAEEFALKEEEKKRKKEMADQSLLEQNTGQVGKKQPILKITKGKLGNKTKKRDHDEEEDANKNNQIVVREIKQMEEMHWKVELQKIQADDLRNRLEQQSIYDLLYEAHELYPDVRKRNQIEILKELIFELKRGFNKEFQDLEKFKNDCIYSIYDKNEQIQELLDNLKQQEELFKPTEHYLEQPELILKTNPDEVKVAKYLSKEEKAALEEEERIKAEREAKLKGDNVQQRGLKNMYGGTELDLKKQKNAMEMDFQMEDWMMTKEEKDMTEEEKTKMKEFRIKEKEYKEKQKKAWEQELKKNKGEIIEIQLKFEERLLQLYKKKLFVDIRILEQELYIVRLVIMLHDSKETKVDEYKYRKEIEKLEDLKREKIEKINTFKFFMQDLERRFADDQKFKDQEKDIKKYYSNYKACLAFVKNGKGKRTQLSEELQQKKDALMAAEVTDLDPFNHVDKERISKQIQEEDEIEHFDFEKDNVGNLSQEDFEKLVVARETRVQMNTDKEKLEKQKTMLQKHIQFHEDKFREIEENYDQQSTARQKALDRIKKIRYNFEMILWLKQGQIEVPQLPVATDYKDAILIQKDIIEDENQSIKEKGKQKIDLMNKIAKFKVDLRKVSIAKERLDLEIIDFEERAKDVQLYRVTKQTQEIIQGKHQKKDEEDKKRLENQIKQLEENAQKRIQTINLTKLKLKREIREKRLESEQLETKARQLQNNVDQRKQIMNLKSKTKDESDADPTKKIKEIAYKRKLLDIAKQQTEEIEVLRDELDRLRAKTFPSFAHLHNKPGYPDEN